MKTPFFTALEFLDAATMNAAAGTVSGNTAGSVSGLSGPGLIHPEALSLGVTGLAVAVQAPIPFQVLFGTGLIAAASGVTTNQVTTSYNVSFSGQVPASGASITAYLLVSGATIYLNPYSVLGPPPGHPDYNPLVVPTTAYATQIDSLSIYTSAAAPDNLTTFEIARTTLASGVTGMTLSTAYQQRAATTAAFNTLQVSGAVSVTAAQGGRTFQFTAPGTATLPTAASANGLSFTFSSQTSGAVTIQVSGSDLIYGSSGTLSLSSITIGQYGSVTLEAQDGIWQVSSCSTNIAATGPYGLQDGGAKSSAFQAFVGFIYDCDQTGGAFTALAPTSGTVSRGSTFAVNSIGTNGMSINWGGLNFVGDPSNTFIAPEGVFVFRYSGVAARGWERSR